MDRTALVGKTITILPNIVMGEPDYIEVGMKAKILAINDADAEVTILKIDLEPFDEVNRPLETACYYDANQNPRLTAREAGCYSPQMEIYAGPLSEIEEWVKIDHDGAVRDLLKDFEATRQGEETYLAWLERQVLVIRAKTSSKT